MISLPYHEIPGLIIDARWFFAQKLINSVKRNKTMHMNMPSTSGMCLSFIHLFIFSLFHSGVEPKVTPEEGAVLNDSMISAVREIAHNFAGDPSAQALQSYTIELKSELRNIDFRLQYLYNQHVNLSTDLAHANLQLKKTRK